MELAILFEKFLTCWLDSISEEAAHKSYLTFKIIFYFYNYFKDKTPKLSLSSTFPLGTYINLQLIKFNSISLIDTVMKK